MIATDFVKAETIQALKMEARSFRQAAAIADALLRRVHRIRGTRWRSVKNTKLVVGRLYFARRAHEEFTFREALAEWTTSGWDIKRGWLPNSTAANTTIEVWQ